MTQLNTSSPQGSEVPFELKGEWWQLKSPRMKRLLQEEKWREKRRSIHIKKLTARSPLERCCPLHNQNRNRAKKGGRKFRVINPV